MPHRPQNALRPTSHLKPMDPTPSVLLNFGLLLLRHAGRRRHDYGPRPREVDLDHVPHATGPRVHDDDEPSASSDRLSPTPWVTKSNARLLLEPEAAGARRRIPRGRRASSASKVARSSSNTGGSLAIAARAPRAAPCRREPRGRAARPRRDRPAPTRLRRGRGARPARSRQAPSAGRRRRAPSSRDQARSLEVEPDAPVSGHRRGPTDQDSTGVGSL